MAGLSPRARRMCQRWSVRSKTRTAPCRKAPVDLRSSDHGTVLHRLVRWTERSPPGLVLGDADADRASQFQHTVESMDGDVRLGRTTLVCARAQPIADHLLEPA